MSDRSKYPDAAFRYGSRLDIPNLRRDGIRFVCFWSAWGLVIGAVVLGGLLS